MKRKVERPYEKDEFFEKWLVGLSPRTKKNYAEEFNDWYVFTGMTSTEQIKKRMHDLTTENLGERQFFDETTLRHLTLLEKEGMVIQRLSGKTRFFRLSNTLKARAVMKLLEEWD